MGAVLGLSLTSDDIVWVLVDAAHRSVLDHDAFEFPDDAEITGTAARGAHAIATASGLEVERVRLTWSDNARHEGLRLLTRLRSMDFDHVDAVPLASVMAVTVDAAHADMAPRLALAYGAALAEVAPSDAITEPVAQQMPAARRFQRPAVYAALGLTAAAGIGVLVLASASVPQVEPAATTAEQSAPADPGWVSVPAPAGASGVLNRKVVTLPSEAAQQATVPVEAAAPVQAADVAVPEPAAALAVPEPAAALAVPEPAAPESVVMPIEPVAAQPGAEPAVALPESEPVGALPAEVPLGQPPLPDVAHLPDIAHLPEAQPAAGPIVGTPAPVPAPGPEMTEPLNVFTALP